MEQFYHHHHIFSILFTQILTYLSALKLTYYKLAQKRELSINTKVSYFSFSILTNNYNVYGFNETWL